MRLQLLSQMQERHPELREQLAKAWPVEKGAMIPKIEADALVQRIRDAMATHTAPNPGKTRQ